MGPAVWTTGWNTPSQSVPRLVASIRGEPFRSSSSAGFITAPPLAGGELRTGAGGLVLGGVRLDLDLSRMADTAPLPNERPAAKEVRHGYQSIEPDLACRRVPLLKTQVHKALFLLSVPARPFRYGAEGPSVRNRTVRNRIFGQISPSTCARR